ncbi:MAG TPA: hypothetical protein VI094_23660 [Propionibacteriaceae bacterium]
MTAVYGASAVKRVRRTKLELAALDHAIIDAVEEDWPVSLRGVYYRVVSIGAVDKTEAGYRAIGRRLLELRRAGEIPYDRITDGTRWVVRPPSYDDYKAALTETAKLYRRNMWRSQDAEVHVFTEKDAITGVIDPITEQWNVPLGVLRGYCSETFAHTMAQAILAARKPVYVYQLGDHDPSGVGAWHDFQRKVTEFAPYAEVTFQRLAVTPAQIALYELPTRPTKQSDTRSRGWVGGSVEVDAIPAPTLRKIVSDAIEQHIDPDELERIELIEESERSLLFELAGRKWPA